jgi:lipid-A-disaccharide synthase-like uncharacterized protein
MFLESWLVHIWAELATRWEHTSDAELFWLSVGFAAQAMFMMRFIIQWLASEKAQASVVPEAFWYWSVAGGAMLLIYALYRMDPVFVFGQATGLFIYARNLHFIRRNRREGQALMREGLKPAE